MITSTQIFTPQKRYSGHKTLLPFSIAKTQQLIFICAHHNTSSQFRDTRHFPRRPVHKYNVVLLLAMEQEIQTYNEKEGRYVSTDCSQLIGA